MRKLRYKNVPTAGVLMNYFITYHFAQIAPQNATRFLIVDLHLTKSGSQWLVKTFEMPFYYEGKFCRESFFFSVEVRYLNLLSQPQRSFFQRRTSSPSKQNTLQFLSILFAHPYFQTQPSTELSFLMQVSYNLVQLLHRVVVLVVLYYYQAVKNLSAFCKLMCK